MLRTRFNLVHVVLVVALLASAGAAQARQMRGLEGLDEAMQPDFVRRDIGTLSRELRITEDQRPIVEAVFAEYESEFDAGLKDVQQKLNDLSPNMGAQDAEIEQRRDALRQQVSELAERLQSGGEEQTPEQMREREAAIRAESERIRAELQQLQRPALEPSQIRQIAASAATILDAWDVRKAELRQQFIGDLLTVLTDEQRELWPAALRRLVREKALPRGRLSGESVDLHTVVNELNPSDDARSIVAPTLEEYSVRLDQALAARNEGITKLRRERMRGTQGEDDEDGAFFAKQMQFRVAVRDVNHEFATRLETELPGEAAGQFAQSYRSRAYPRIYRATAAQRAFTAAMELEDLNDTQRSAVAAIHAGYLAELMPLNEQLIGAVRQHEPTEQPARGRARRARESAQQAQPAPDPVREGFEKRNELGDRHLEQLKAQLTPEQWAKLPVGRAEEREAQAASEGRGGGRRDGREDARRDIMIRQFDTNGDGTLDESERNALREHIRQQRRGTRPTDEP